MKKRLFNDDRQKILFSFESIKSIAGRVGSPKFVFAHNVATHPPFVFGAQGEPVDITVSTDENPWLAKEAYKNQLQFANKKTLEVVDAILAHSENPVIIIQGDHGPASTGAKTGKGVKEYSDELAMERMKILNAYLFPDGCRDKLYPSISPVNTFRVFLSCQFGADLPSLEDKGYFSEEDSQYGFRDVTELAKKKYAK